MHNILQEELYRHARIRIHVGKTQVWNAADDGDLLERIAQASDPEARDLECRRTGRSAFWTLLWDIPIMSKPSSEQSWQNVKFSCRASPWWRMSSPRTRKSWESIWFRKLQGVVDGRHHFWPAHFATFGLDHFWPKPLFGCFRFVQQWSPELWGPKRWDPEGWGPEGGSRRQGDHHHVGQVLDPSQRTPDEDVVQWLC